MDVTGINRDEAIIDKLGWAYSHLADVQTMMEGHVVCGGHWPEVGRLLHEIERTLKHMELGIDGRLG